MAITLFAFLCLLCALQVYLLHVCKKKKFHTQVNCSKLLTLKIIWYILIALILEIISALFTLIHLIKFARDGVGVPKLPDVALCKYCF